MLRCAAASFLSFVRNICCDEQEGTGHELEEAEQLATGWVEKEELEAEEAITRELQSELDRLVEQKAEKNDPHYYLRLFEDLIEANEEAAHDRDSDEERKHTLEVAHKVRPKVATKVAIVIDGANRSRRVSCRSASCWGGLLEYGWYLVVYSHCLSHRYATEVSAFKARQQRARAATAASARTTCTAQFTCSTARGHAQVSCG